MKCKVKICGIKTLEAAQAALDAGADFLGFNFVPTSKRYIRIEETKEIIESTVKDRFILAYSSSKARSSRPSASNNIKLVGVFQNEKIDVVNKVINYLKLDYVQLHGNESPDYAARIHNAAIIKTFALPSDFNVEETMEKMKTYKADYFLLDREVQGRGELLNLKKVYELTSIFPIILGGGLTPENVAAAVKFAKLQVVDVACGVETDGEKDRGKIKEFIEKAKSINIMI